MQKLIYFIRKIAVVVIFVILEIIAISTYATSTPYTEARMLAWSNSVFGSISSVFEDVSSFFALRKENISLTEHIAKLETRIHELELAQSASRVVVDDVIKQYDYLPAQVVVSSTNRSRNYIILNKGGKDGVMADMAVMTPEGYAVGVVVDCTENMSIAKLLLTTGFSIGGVLVEDGSHGSVVWSGGDSKHVDFVELQKYANVQEGNIVKAYGLSQYFPKEAIIGTVERVELNEKGSSYNCKIRLAANMEQLNNVVLVRNVAMDELKSLEGYIDNN